MYQAVRVLFSFCMGSFFYLGKIYPILVNETFFQKCQGIRKDIKVKKKLTE